MQYRLTGCYVTNKTTTNKDAKGIRKTSVWPDDGVCIGLYCRHINRSYHLI